MPPILLPIPFNVFVAFSIAFFAIFTSVGRVSIRRHLQRFQGHMKPNAVTGDGEHRAHFLLVLANLTSLASMLPKLIDTLSALRLLGQGAHTARVSQVIIQILRLIFLHLLTALRASVGIRPPPWLSVISPCGSMELGKGRGQLHNSAPLEYDYREQEELIKPRSRRIPP